MLREQTDFDSPRFLTSWPHVVALPKERPVIVGLQQVYSSGDVIKANCSSPRSKPIASLAWFVNGVLMDRFSLDYYALPVDGDGLSEATLGLNVRVEMALFPAGGPLELRCTATVQERTWERTAHVNLARLSNQMLAQDPGSAAVQISWCRARRNPFDDNELL
ncbi:hypothetical protein B566_EDAN000895 [Ephemera danica]|nr:hypothetical protein B566_EDAN000895 [Ephemera danica]